MQELQEKFNQLSSIKDDWELRAHVQELFKSVSDWIQKNLDDPEKVKSGRELNKKISCFITNSNLKKRNVAVSDAKKVTQSLTQALEIMNTECSRSIEATQTLIASNEILLKSDKNISSFSSLLGTSNKIVSNLQRKDWIERIMILFGLFIFFLTVFYIISKRF